MIIHSPSLTFTGKTSRFCESCLFHRKVPMKPERGDLKTCLSPDTPWSGYLVAPRAFECRYWTSK